MRTFPNTHIIPKLYNFVNTQIHTIYFVYQDLQIKIHGGDLRITLQNREVSLCLISLPHLFEICELTLKLLWIDFQTVLIYLGQYCLKECS